MTFQIFHVVRKDCRNTGYDAGYEDTEDCKRVQRDVFLLRMFRRMRVRSSQHSGFEHRQ